MSVFVGLTIAMRVGQSILKVGKASLKGSLPLVFYEMLTGELPLGKFQPPSGKVQIDVRLDEVVLRALAKEPELRYQQAVD